MSLYGVQTKNLQNFETRVFRELAYTSHFQVLLKTDIFRSFYNSFLWVLFLLFSEFEMTMFPALSFSLVA